MSRVSRQVSVLAVPGRQDMHVLDECVISPTLYAKSALHQAIHLRLAVEFILGWQGSFLT